MGNWLCSGSIPKNRKGQDSSPGNKMSWPVPANQPASVGGRSSGVTGNGPGLPGGKLSKTSGAMGSTVKMSLVAMPPKLPLTTKSGQEPEWREIRSPFCYRFRSLLPDSLRGIVGGVVVPNKRSLTQKWKGKRDWFTEVLLRLSEQVAQVTEWPGQNPLVVLAVIAFLGIIYFLFWQIPVGQLESLREKNLVDLYQLKATIRGTLAQAFGVVFLLVGLYFAWRRVVATEEGQITERFTRAIDQLGNEKLAIRLGGIYALERIAKDSEKDHWPVMEVLTAYVREHAQWDEHRQEDMEDACAELPEDLRPVYRPSVDIQAILTVLGRRQRTFGKGEENVLDLSGTDLRGADLRNAHFESAFLERATLERANLAQAHFEGVVLDHAYLNQAFLFGTHLEKASLYGTLGIRLSSLTLSKQRQS